MITQKSMFVVAIGLAGVSASVLAFKNYGIELTETNLMVLVIAAVVAVTAVILFKSRDLILFSTKKGKELKSSEDLSKLLGLDSVTLHEKHVVAKRGNRISCHAFFKIISVPYQIDELNREKQIFVVGNFVRLLSTLNFAFEIIPRILPVSPTVYLNQLHKEINDLRITLSAEGNIADSRREARLKHLEKLANRLQDGESVRDVSFLIHIMVDGNSEETIERELETNAKTLAAALESGLNVNAVRLARHEMLGTIRDFFRVTMTISPRKSLRMMVWSLSFLIPLAKPKLPPLRKLLSGVYLGRTYSGAIVSIDLESYVNPHLVCLGTSGGGKSTSVKSLISRRHDLFETSIAILDYAGEYESWVSSRGGTVIDMSKKTINPFDLGPATLADRIRQLTDMFEKICEFETINQRFAFAHYLNLAYTNKGFKINDDSTWKTETPTLENVTQLMEDDIPSLPMQRQAIVISLLSRVKELASGPFGIFGKSDVSIDSLMQGFVCIKLSTISNNSLKDAISYTILQFIDSKMRLQGMQKQIKFILVLDEAWKLAKDPKSLPVTLIKEGRKYGYSLIVASQDATDDLAPQILSNAGTVIIHRLSYPKYLKYLKEAYNLIDVEIERIRDLAVGHAYVKIGNDPRGFFVKVDMEEVESKQETQIIEKPIAQVIGQTASTAISEPKEKILPIMPNPGKIRASSDSLGAEQLYGKLSPKARKLLKAIAKNPELPTTEYYKMLGLNSYQGNKAKSELEKHYFIDGVELPKITGKGRQGRVLRLTKTGYGVVNQSQSTYRFGGTIHRYLVNLIAKKFYEHKIEYEYPIGEGKRVDIVIDGTIAVEVERRDYSESNITKCLQAGFEKVIVVCQTRKQVERFKGLLSEELATDARLTITDISSFLGEET